MANSPEIKNRIVDHGTRPASEFCANPKNWRTHPMNQRAAVSSSLKELGWIDTVIVNKRTGYLVDGHERLRQALKQGDDTPVPFIEVDLSEEEEALALATLDPITGMATVDKQKLDELMQEISTDEEALNDMLSELAEDNGLEFGDSEEPPEDAGAQIDKAEELRQKWGVETGQLWQLGEHRIICGDCTDKAVVERLMGGEKANLLFTSPPYWVGMDYETQKSEKEIDDFIHSCVRCWTDFILVDRGRIVINTGTSAIHRIEKRRKVEVLPLIFMWQAHLRQSGWLARHYRVWAKRGGFAGGLVSPKTDAIDQHWETITDFEHEDTEFEEPQYIGTFWAPSGKQRGQERVKTKWAQQGVWSDVHGEKSADGKHVAAFPIEIPERNIKLYSKENEFTIEPFSGSGTTLIACERLNRKCRAIEISPAYVAVAIQRWADTTGKEPELLTE